MFLDNKYSRWYYRIIDGSKLKMQNGYTERHHIHPRSLGGSDEPLNIATLSAKEHWVCHLLLCKMTTGMDHRKMLFALKCMRMGKNTRYTSRVYEYFKPKIAQAISENNTGHSWNKGIKKTQEHIENMKAAFAASSTHKKSARKNFQHAAMLNKGKSRPEHLKKQWSDKKIGIPKTSEEKLSMSIAAKKRCKRASCIKCRREFTPKKLVAHLRGCCFTSIGDKFVRT